MKVKLGIVLILVVTIVVFNVSLKSKKIDYEPVSLYTGGSDVIGIRNYVGLFEEPNVYFFEKNSEVMLYSNLEKSGFNNYHISNMKMIGKKLQVSIDGSKNNNKDSADLMIKINIEQLPEKIEVTFMGKKIKNYIVVRA